MVKAILESINILEIKSLVLKDKNKNIQISKLLWNICINYKLYFIIINYSVLNYNSYNFMPSE